MAVGISLVLLGLAVYLPALNSLLKMEPLTGGAWLIVLAVALFNILMMEGVKAYYVRKGSR